MQRKNTYKSKGLKLKKNFNFLLFLLFLSLITTSCNSKKDTKKNIKKDISKKVELDEKDPLYVEVIHPEKLKQGTLTDIDIKLSNKGSFPISIISIQIGKPRTTKNFKGTSPLRALKHKFKKNEKFTREFFLDEKFSERKEHVVPEVHKLEAIIYPGTTKTYKVKAITQNIKKNIYKNRITIGFIYLQKEWHDKIYVFKGRTTPEDKTLVKELFVISKELPKKIENNLLASNDLGKIKYKIADITIKLDGWNLNTPEVYSEETIFIKDKNIWMHYNSGNTVIVHEDGKTETLKNINVTRIFSGAILKGKTKKLFIKKSEYKNLEKEIKDFKFILNQSSSNFETKLNLRQLNDFFDKIYSKGYSIHKYGEIIKVK